MALADGLYHHATTKRDLHLAKEVPKLPVSFLHDLNKHNVYSARDQTINHTKINVIDADVDVGTNATTWVPLISVGHIQ